MPIRHGGRLATRASTWPRDHFLRSTIAPRWSWPTMWNEFLPISMPITVAIAVLCLLDMACSLSWVPIQLRSLAGQEHARTVPFPASPDRQLPHCERFIPPCVGYLAQAVTELDRHAGQLSGVRRRG